MDPQLLNYYNRELQYIRESGAEFAKEYPKIAGRLGLEGLDCTDPYVERLLEGFAFLAARVQLRIDAEFPELAQHLLDVIYPHYLSPLPSAVIVQLKPNLNDAALNEGVTIPRDTPLKTMRQPGQNTVCEFRSTQDTTLWPISIRQAEYFSNIGAIADIGLPTKARPRAGIKLQVATEGGTPFSQLNMDSLRLYLPGRDDKPMRLYEQLLGNSCAIVVRPADRPDAWVKTLRADNIKRCGFSDDEAMLPGGPRSFSGYRLVHEYFAFPEKFLFVDITGLRPAVSQCEESALELTVIFDHYRADLENNVNADDFALHCVPAINLFNKRTDRIHISNATHEYHVVPDRSRPLDFEIFQVQSVTGHGDQDQNFLPLYACNDFTENDSEQGYFTQRRAAHLTSSNQKQRSNYLGSETYVSLVDSREAPFNRSVGQLSFRTLCTNRDLPLTLTPGRGATDFQLDVEAPLESIRILKGPSRPRPSLALQKGEMAWRLINHLSLNYLSLIDEEDGKGAGALRTMLSLYERAADVTAHRQIEGVLSISSQTVTRRIPIDGPIAFGRGISIEVTLDEHAFEGTGIFLIGAILEQFFARFASINSFTETVIKSAERGEVMRWPVRIGQRQTL